MAMERESRMVKLMSSDGEVFEVDAALMESPEAIESIIAANTLDYMKRLMSRDMMSLAVTKIMQYYNKHLAHYKAMEMDNNNNSSSLLRVWDEELMHVPLEAHYFIITGACHLGMKGLKQLVARTMFKYVAGKSNEEIRRMFCNVQDLTHEELQELQVKKRYPWLFYSTKNENLDPQILKYQLEFLFK